MCEFYFSKRIVKRNNKLVFLALGVNTPFLLCFALVIDDFDVRGSLMFTVLTLFFVGVILLIEMLLFDSKQSRTKFIVDNSGVTRQCGKKQTLFRWKDFSELIVSRSKKGQIHYIKLYKDGRKLMSLHGLDEAEKFIDLFSQKKVNGTHVHSKPYLLDWDNTLQMLFVFVVITFLLYLVLILGYLILF